MLRVRPGHIAIIGASLAGLRTAEGLRRGGFDGRLTLVGAEPHLPYSRPPLSKQVLTGAWEPDRAQLRPPDALAALDLDLRLGTAAHSLDIDRQVVTLADGELGYDQLVLATGASPRLLPDQPLAGVHVLRTLDDSLALRDAMAEGTRLVIVGAGFIGAEVAAAARQRGLDVTVVEPLAAPMVRGLGLELGEVAAKMHIEQGVDLRCGVAVTGLEGEDRVSGVALGDGTVLPADVVVVGIGVVPNTAWLEGSGLTLDDGVHCDATLAAVGAEGVWAVGDVARWAHPGYDERVRFEHWTVAAEHAQAVAENILAGPGAARPHAPVPYVWSDQYGTKIQIVGRAEEDDDLDVVHGSLADRRFVAVRSRDGVVTGAVGFGSPRVLMALHVRLGHDRLDVREAKELVAA